MFVGGSVCVCVEVEGVQGYGGGRFSILQAIVNGYTVVVVVV